MHATQESGSVESVARLGDDELVAALHRLLRQERRLTAALIVHLAELDARGLYRQHAYSSTFEYCVEALHLSEAEAYLRIRAARLGREFPRVLQMLAAGELHLSAVKLLAPILTQENCQQLLEAARFKSKREVELLLAQREPKPDVPNVIRRLPQPELVPERGAQEQTSLLVMASSAPSQDLALNSQSPAPAVEHESVPSAPRIPAARPTSAVSPLGDSRYKLQLTASQRLHDKLRQAQDLLRHELPDGDVPQVLERALDLLIAQRMKRTFGLSDKPRASRQVAPRPGGRYVPNHVRRAALERDGARCSFVSPDGKRCAQQGWLQLHHEQPFARGGLATSENIHVLCRSHNQLLAERDYGTRFIQRRIEQQQRHRSPGRST